MSDEIPRKRRRGPIPKLAHEKRQHSVSCRLTDDELALLDKLRGQVSRGEWLRLSAFAQPPRIVPEVNKIAWSDLARTAANLNQLTRIMHLNFTDQKNRLETSKALMDLRSKLADVRALLIGSDGPS